MYQQRLVTIETGGRRNYEITERVAAFVESLDMTAGLCHVFIRHTSASLMITENADPDVWIDLETFFQDLVPDGDPRYLHMAEGKDDMPAHVRSALTQTSLSIPFMNSRLQLGTWQGIYLWEHRFHGHSREIVLSAVG